MSVLKNYVYQSTVGLFLADNIPELSVGISYQEPHIPGNRYRFPRVNDVVIRVALTHLFELFYQHPYWCQLYMSLFYLHIIHRSIYLCCSVADIPFPKTFTTLCSKILTRLFRVFVHVYIHHFDRIVSLGAVSRIKDEIFSVFTVPLKRYQKWNQRPWKPAIL